MDVAEDHPPTSSSPSPPSSSPPSHRRASSTPMTTAVAVAVAAAATAAREEEANDGIHPSPPPPSSPAMTMQTSTSPSTSAPGGPTTMMQWFNPPHLLAGALFRGEHHRQAAAGGQQQQLSQQQQQQQQQPHQWLAAGMEIVAGIMTAAGGGGAAEPDSAVAPSSSEGTTDGSSAATATAAATAGTEPPRPAPAEEDEGAAPHRPPSRRQQPDNDDGGVDDGNDENEDEDGGAPLLPRKEGGGEELGEREDHHHPIALRRSASSAFGSPWCAGGGSSSTSSSSMCDYGIRGRTHSYSGHSDPGAASTTSTTSTSTSAFHAWSCRSLYSSGRCSGSRDDGGSDVGSAVSSSVANGGAGTASSDPLPSRGPSGHGGGGGREFCSPWRRVMDRMKKNGGGGRGRKDGGGGGAGPGRAPFGRTLSGRENPVRPDLSDDEDRRGAAAAAASPPPSRTGTTAKDDDEWAVGRDGDRGGTDPGSPPARVGVVVGSKKKKKKKKEASPPSVGAKAAASSSTSSTTTTRRTTTTTKKKGRSKSTTVSPPPSAPSSTDGHTARGKAVADELSAESSFVTKKASTVTNTIETNHSERQYDDPGVALDLSDDSDTDDDGDVIEPIVGNDILSHDVDGGIGASEGTPPFTHTNHIVPPSQLGGRTYDHSKAKANDYDHPFRNQDDPRLPPLPPSGITEQVSCEGIEVISTSVTSTPLHGQRSASATSQMTTIIDGESSILGSVQIFTPNNSIHGNSPPSVERLTNILQDLNAGENDNFLFHPFGCGGEDEDEHDDEHDDSFNVEERQHSVNNIQFPLNQQQVILKYRSPQRSSSSPNQLLSSSLCDGAMQHHRGNAASGSAHNEHSPSSSSQDSPDSRYSSLGGSPASRKSSSNSRTTTSTLNSGVDRTINTLHSIDRSLVVDHEVRDANRRSVRGGCTGVSSGASISGDGEETNNQEVMVGPDGNDTVFSSSTSSSNYHGCFSSPRPLRDGATMPVDRFFAGGNVTMSPSPPRGEGSAVYPASAGGGAESAAAGASSLSAPSISKFFCPKNFPRINTRDGTHSPHTVSSNSVSANSSTSGSEAKKPLQFVAYQIREEMESPFDEPPVTAYAAVVGANGVRETSNACSPLLKPRITKVGGGSSQQQQQRRPPMIQRPLVSIIQKPPQSPRKQDTNTVPYGRSRTPTRTPPPSWYNYAMNSSGANTPCSPPVIIDGPSNAAALCGGDSSMTPTRPYVVRRSADLGISNVAREGMILVHPASSYRPQVCTDAAAAAAAISPSVDLQGVGLPDDVDNVALYAILTTSRGGNLDTVEETAATTLTTKVTPERSPSHNTARRLHIIAPKPEMKVVLGENAAIVSPENKIYG